MVRPSSISGADLVEVVTLEPRVARTAAATAPTPAPTAIAARPIGVAASAMNAPAEDAGNGAALRTGIRLLVLVRSSACRPRPC